MDNKQGYSKPIQVILSEKFFRTTIWARGPNLVKNLDFGLLLGMALYNSADITHYDLIQWILSAIDVI